MYGKVHIGEKEIEMVANAASPYIYRQVFHEDFLKKIQEKDIEPDLFVKMGFIMMKQAEKGTKMSDLMKLTMDSFYEWLFGFEAMDVLQASAEISNIYLGQTGELSTPKNEGV